MTDYAAIIPLLIVALAGCRRDARGSLPSARRAHADCRPRPDRPGRRRGRLGVPLGHRPQQLRRHPRRQLLPVHQHHALHHRRADDAVLERRGRAGAAAGRRVLRADAVRHLRHDDDGRRGRPAGRLHRARDPVARRLRADRAAPVRASPAPRRRSSTSCSDRSRAPSSSTASRSSTRSPARRGSSRSASRCRRRAPRRRRRWRFSASACSRSASRSRSRRCRSTCGRPTPTKARRPSSPRSCPPASRLPRSRPSRACSCRRWSRCRRTGSRCSRSSPR